MSIDGLVLVRPTSVDYSGTSATVNNNGTVDFSSITSLSLNGVFSSLFDNYQILLNANTASPFTFSFRYRSSGTDNSDNSYTVQRLDINGGSIQSSRATLTYTNAYPVNNSLSTNGYITHVYGPFLSQPTAHRIISQYTENNAQYYDTATTHSGSISFDGFTIYTGSSNASGTIAVFGWKQ